MHILYVSDGKAGHRSQALGLYHAIRRQHPQTDLVEQPIEQLSLMSLVWAVFKGRLATLNTAPDMIIGVGTHTHLRVWLLSKIFVKAKTVILMKPSLPISCFDYAIIPAHDGVQPSRHVIITQGALNPIVNEQRHEQQRILIAIGGSSKRHQWNEAKVLHAIAEIVQNDPSTEIVLTTSRRTPQDFVPHLANQPYAQQLKIFPVEQTPTGWIFEQMQLANAVWVTEDSVSMIFEALTAGCKVGIIKIDRLKSDRITQMLDQLPQEYISSGLWILQNNIALNEADRVATRLLDSMDFSST